MQVQVTGIAWYAEDDYPEILRIMADAQVLPDTYGEWKQKAEGMERQASAQGIRVVRAIIDPKQFPAWCRLRGLNVDAKARLDFASREAHRVAQG